jgi:hypothetical protein
MDARRRKRRVKTEDAQKEEVDAKRPKAAEEPAEVNPFLAQWLWKREAKSDVEKFEHPYDYPCESGGVLVVQQSPFSAEVCTLHCSCVEPPTAHAARRASQAPCGTPLLC